MVTRSLTLEGSGAASGTALTLESQEFAALNGGNGFGLVDMDVRWFAGAGHGDVYRGSRARRRVIPLPILIQAPDADALQERMSTLARILDPENAPARLRQDQGEHSWWVDVVRSGGGDPVMGKDTNGSSWAVMDVTLESGDPFWTRERSASKIVKPSGVGRGLLKGATSLTRLRLSSGQAMGTVVVDNPGDAAAYPVVLIQGPGTSATIRSARGEVLTWAGNLSAAQRRIIDHRARTITDPDDTSGDPDRYEELGPAPQFWSIPPGSQAAFIDLQGASGGVLTPTGPTVRTNRTPYPQPASVWGGSYGGGTATATTETSGGPGDLASWRKAAFTAAPTSTAVAILTAGTTTGTMVPVTPGETITISTWQAASQAVSARQGALWYDAAGANVGSAYGNYVPLPAQEWQRRSLTVVVPAGVAYLRPQPFFAQSAVGVLDVGDWIGASACLVESGDVLGAYMDGDTPDTEGAWYEWTGAVNASPSTMRDAYMAGQSSVTLAWAPRRWLVV